MGSVLLLKKKEENNNIRAFYIYFGISIGVVSTLIFCMCRGEARGCGTGKVTKLSRVTFIGKTFRYNQNKIQFHFHLDMRTDPLHSFLPSVRPSVRLSCLLYTCTRM